MAKRTLKQTFLTIPLKYQISLAIFLILVIYCIIITALIFSFINMIRIIFINNSKYYFFSMNQELFHTIISFYNLCLLQYEEMVKNFNEQTYIYLSSLSLLYDNIISFKNDNVVNNYLDQTNYTIDIKQEQFYLYCTNEQSYNLIYSLITNNSLSTINLLSAINSFRITYYGNFSILHNYLFNIIPFGCTFSQNITKMKEYFDLSSNDILSYLGMKNIYYYYSYKPFFEIYRRTKFSLFDIIFPSKIFIFDNYIKLIQNGEDENTLEEYIKEQNIYFQFINYGTGETYINNNANLKLSSSMNINTIINNFLDYFFLELIAKQYDIINIPLYIENNTILSKNLCYFFLLKQIRLLNNTVNINNIFNENKLNEIYNNLQKGFSTIEDCILDKYYSNENLNKIGYLFKNNFYNYFQLENCRKEMLFKLVKNNENSYFYFIQSVYPLYTSLKDLEPRYFPISQLFLYSFLSATPSIKAMNNSIEKFNLSKRIASALLIYEWIILLFIIIYISNRIKYILIKPILNLKDTLDLKEITDETKFEYKYDDEINKFFQSCKLLLSTNTERRNDSNNIDTFNKDIIKNSKNKEESIINNNNNMILNIKLINELIESGKKQESKGKIIEWNWKQIYNKQKMNKGILNKNQNFLIKKRNFKKRITSPTNLISLKKNSLNFNAIESKEKNESKTSENEDDEYNENNDFIIYKSFLLIIEFIYNNDYYAEKFKKYKKTKNINILNKIKYFFNIENNANKDITYIWYSKLKENNKNDFVKSYFNKSFEDILIDENSNNNVDNSIIK